MTGNDNNTSRRNWREWCIQVYERVAEGGGCACMPLPFDAKMGGGDDGGGVMMKSDDRMAGPEILQKLVKKGAFETEEEEEDPIVRIDHLYLQESRNVTTLPLSAKTDATRRISVISTSSTATPFPLLKLRKQGSIDARFLDSRSFDSLARSTDTGMNTNNFNRLERELPSFGTHHTCQSHHTRVSSYDSQAYTPALSSYLYRCRTERSLQKTTDKFGMGGGMDKFPPQHSHRSTSMSSIMTMPTSNQHSLHAVQHCE